MIIFAIDMYMYNWAQLHGIATGSVQIVKTQAENLLLSVQIFFF